MRDHDGDIAALQAGLHVRRPARNGLRLYTTDFDSVSLSDSYRGRQAFLADAYASWQPPAPASTCGAVSLAGMRRKVATTPRRE